MLNLEKRQWIFAGNADALADGHQLEKATLLFEKIEDKTVEAQVQKLLDTKKMNELESKEVPEIKEEIVFDDFMKLDIRVGTILEAEPIKKSKKLLKFLIDDGFEKKNHSERYCRAL